jgi:hypothetical protein
MLLLFRNILKDICKENNINLWKRVYRGLNKLDNSLINVINRIRDS